ncbi:MAG: ImmA/IrrE family metallo-endopeptidase [Calditrichaeota bacterium]|nr:MAG: ImmA/IrrE family metallo-endopeptidase [Calditrichota bacterium]
MQVAIKPELLRWARERAGRTVDSLAKLFPKYEQWERGEAQPTLKQLERLAKTLHVPLGFLFLEAPPEEPLPIPDFRTMPQARLSRPSAELLDTIYICQQRQEWYRNYLLSMGETPLPFVASATVEDDANIVAAEIRNRVKLNIEERRTIPTWTQALSRFIDQVEQIGVLVMMNGVVGNNTHRPLDPEEFRGFALVDDLAPLIFINGADTLSGKTFTLAHELAHIWLGESGISDAQLDTYPEEKVERWCNQVAAEMLVPMSMLQENYDSGNELSPELNRLARIFKVSTLVILRRLYEAKFIDWETYRQVYEEELERLLSYERPATEEGGGNFYRSLSRRVSKRFALALISSTLEGQTLFRDAFAMLGVSKGETFRKFAQELGVE